MLSDVELLQKLQEISSQLAGLDSNSPGAVSSIEHLEQELAEALFLAARGEECIRAKNVLRDRLQGEHLGPMDWLPAGVSEGISRVGSMLLKVVTGISISVHGYTGSGKADATVDVSYEPAGVHQPIDKDDKPAKTVDSPPLEVEDGDSEAGGPPVTEPKDEIYRLDINLIKHWYEQADPTEIGQLLASLPEQPLIVTAEIAGREETYRRCEKVLMGIRLRGSSPSVAMKKVNQWISQASHKKAFAEASNDTRESVVDCLRAVGAALNGQYYYVPEGDSQKVPVSIRCGTNQRGKRRFTVSESGGKRSTLSQTLGIPELILEAP